MFDMKELADLVNGNDWHDSPAGGTAYFVPIDNEWGIKVYSYKDKRDQSYTTQRVVYEMGGPAPAVGATFDVGDKFAYITERVEMLYDEDEYLEWKKTTGWEDEYNPRMKAKAEYRDLINSTTREIKEEYHHYIWDTHPGNYGFNKEGRLVYIDWTDVDETE
jgi:hypothetical protein